MPREIPVKHTHFTLSYNEGNELPSWAAYALTPDMAKASRTIKENMRKILLFQPVPPLPKIIGMPVFSWDSPPKTCIRALKTAAGDIPYVKHHSPQGQIQQIPVERP